MDNWFEAHIAMSKKQKGRESCWRESGKTWLLPVKEKEYVRKRQRKGATTWQSIFICNPPWNWTAYAGFGSDCPLPLYISPWKPLIYPKYITTPFEIKSQIKPFAYCNRWNAATTSAECILCFDTELRSRLFDGHDDVKLTTATSYCHTLFSSLE